MGRVIGFGFGVAVGVIVTYLVTGLVALAQVVAVQIERRDEQW